MTNLGFTIRSAKWSRYGRPNVSTKLSESYTHLFKLFFTLLFIFIMLFFYKMFYVQHPIFNSIFNLLWLSIDNVFYIFSFFYFCSILLIQYSFNSILNFLYLGTYKNALPETKLFNNKTNNIVAPKISWKIIFYSWIINGSPYPTSVESIFSDNNSNNQDNLNLTQKLFQITFDLNLINNSIYPFLPSLFSQDNFLRYLTIFDSSISLNYSSPLLLHNLTHKSYKKDTQIQKYFSSNFRWNLYKFTRKEHFSAGNNYKLKGFFYTPSFNTKLLNFFSQNFYELSFLHTNLLLESKTIKWRYWLYRYNTLHRNTLKSAQSLTIVKNLLTTGFYDTKLTQTNIWGSNETRINSLFTQPTYSLLYNTGFNLVNPFLFNNNQFVFKDKNLLNLSYYEQSYLWLIQRMHFFSTMKNNHIFYTPFYNYYSDYNCKNFDNTQVGLKILKSVFFKSPYLSNSIVSFQTSRLFNIQSSDNNIDNFTITNSPIFTTSLRDLYPKKNSFNFFNYTSLSILLELFQNQSNFNSKPSFFGYKELFNHSTDFDFKFTPLHYKNRQSDLQLKLTPIEAFNEKAFLLDLKTLVFILSL